MGRVFRLAERLGDETKKVRGIAIWTELVWYAEERFVRRRVFCDSLKHEEVALHRVAASRSRIQLNAPCARRVCRARYFWSQTYINYDS